MYISTSCKMFSGVNKEIYDCNLCESTSAHKQPGVEMFVVLVGLLLKETS